MGHYDRMTIAEIVHDYAVVRGDLSEQYARDQLVSIIEARIRAAEDDAAQLRADWITPCDRCSECQRGQSCTAWVD